MIIASICALAVAASPVFDAAEYFPVVPGTKWTYNEETRYGTRPFVDEALEPVNLGSEKVFPIETRQDGQLVQTMYYRLVPDGVLIAALDLKAPLEVPQPLFFTGDRGKKWSFTGTTDFFAEKVALEIKGSAALKGKRKVLKTEAECLEVRIEARIGPQGQKPIVSHQTFTYAKGIGLIDMVEKTSLPKGTEERKLKLVEFTPGKE